MARYGNWTSPGRRVRGEEDEFPQAFLHSKHEPGYYIAGGPCLGMLHWDYQGAEWVDSTYAWQEGRDCRWYGTAEELDTAWPEAVRTLNTARALIALGGE